MDGHNALWMFRVVFDLFAQPADMHIHDLRLPGEFTPPHARQELFIRKHLTRVQRKLVQQVELEQRGQNLLFCLDVSNSMRARDVAESPRRDRRTA